MAKQIFEHVVSEKKLRSCQKEAYQKAREHYARAGAERSTIIQLPTGAGKTGLIAIAPFAIARKKVLVLTPNVKLARDIADKLDIIRNQSGNIFRELAIFDDTLLSSLELFVLRLEGSANASGIDEHHIIVSNYHQLQDLQRWFGNKRDLVDLIIIDEAHHQAAATYRQVLEFFPNARVLGLTATPFRSDGKPVEGKPLYKYPFHRAVGDGIIRNIRVINTAPEAVQLRFSDNTNKIYSLEEMLQLKEQAWFNRDIALSQDCCDSIARKAKEKLDTLRTDFPTESSQIIASAISKRHAREFVKPAFEKLALKVGLVSSDEQDKKTNDETFRKLRQEKIDVIANIGMLGEGFDHPPLGVAAIFRPYKTLNPYIQFIGRVLRRNGSVTHSYIVSHVGLNQLKRFEEFKLFDYEDQEFLKRMLADAAVNESEEQSFVEEGGGRLPARVSPTLTETGDSQLEIASVFVSPSGHGVKDVMDRFQALGDDDRQRFLKLLGVDPQTVTITPQARDSRVLPSDRRKADRNLLNEREKSIATDVIQELGLKHKGRDFNKRFENFPWVKRRVSSMVNDVLGKESGKRREVSNEEYSELDARGVLKDIYKKALSYFRARKK